MPADGGGPDIGLVNQCNGLADPAAWLADGGREVVRKIRAHRSDPGDRVTAARTAALAHTYEAKLSGDEHPGAAGAAVCIRGHGEFLAAPLCVRGSVDERLRRERSTTVRLAWRRIDEADSSRAFPD